MALANFSLPFSGLPTQNWAATVSPLQPHHATAVNSLLYGPAGHQESDEPPVGVSPEEYYKNDPYSPPSSLSSSSQSHNQYNSRPKTNNNYLPPPPPPLEQQPPPPHSSSSLSSSSLSSSSLSSSSPQSSSSLSQRITPQQQRTQRGPQFNQPSATYLPTQQQQPHQPSIRTYGEGSYGDPPSRNNVQQPLHFLNDYNSQPRTTYSSEQQPQQPQQPLSPQSSLSSSGDYAGNQQGDSDKGDIGITDNGGYPHRPPGFTRVQAGQGSRTQVHAVLDYDADDDDEYYDHDEEHNFSGKSLPTVTPIQGPIYLKNGTVPVVPLFSYPTVNNGTFVQIPIWWTALSVALGLDIRGDIIRGVPCVKRYHQLFCPTAGNSYPIDKIEKFIDDNKALMRRMYGDFEMQTTGGGFATTKKRRRSTDEPDAFDIPGVPDMISKPGSGAHLELTPDSEIGETYFGKLRKKRQGTNFRGGGGGGGRGRPGPGGGGGQGNKRNKNDAPNSTPESGTGRVDACESKIEIVTPYWASNSAGKIRAIVNTQHFEQAIHQEICTKVQTGRCSNDCGCEQKYKWHRLLAYDPDNDCKGIFMDWFLFPSCCVCRCSP